MQHTTTIKVLPQTVVEKIAAGEVVERPGSVLKELIVNSIDASSTCIDVFLEDAGFSLIKVVDNGLGMSSEDLRLCLLPHATSKISSADDLYAVATMGFRGEAMGSIAAVSRVQVESSSSEDGLGFRISSDGGAVHELLPCPHNRGTTVSVRDLFQCACTKKFMKTHRGEQLACMRFFEQIAIPFPSVHFTLSIDNKKVLEFPIASSPLERIGAVAGNQFARRLIECRGSRPGMEALIYVSSPEDLKERPRFNSLFVNLRRIDNDSVTFAVREAFSQFLGSSFRPSFFCFLDIDPSRIDVNVHPTKQQVKFDNSGICSVYFLYRKEQYHLYYGAAWFIPDRRNTLICASSSLGQFSSYLFFRSIGGDVHFLSPGAAARDSGQFSDHSSIPREQLRAISERS